MALTTPSSTRLEHPLRLAVIGDVHDLWEPEDGLALEHLNVDLALFVGDFGNESVAVVEAVARLPLPIAVALGNHDAWYSATPWGLQQCPYDRQQEDWVQEQLDLLGLAHVGYGCRNFAELGLGVVGGRPFSWGGPEWKYAEFYQQRFGVGNFAESTRKIVEPGLASPESTLIVLSHNGPAGLGNLPEDPCGRDWQPLGGDYGDPDLQQAIAQLKTAGKRIPLVTFGHMHHQLRHTRKVTRTAVRYLDGTVYLNAALVPRIVRTPLQTRRQFALVELAASQVQDVRLVWLDDNLQTVSSELIYCLDRSGELEVAGSTT